MTILQNFWVTKDSAKVGFYCNYKIRLKVSCSWFLLHRITFLHGLVPHLIIINIYHHDRLMISSQIFLVSTLYLLYPRFGNNQKSPSPKHVWKHHRQNTVFHLHTLLSDIFPKYQNLIYPLFDTAKSQKFLDFAFSLSNKSSKVTKSSSLWLNYPPPPLFGPIWNSL